MDHYKENFTDIKPLNRFFTCIEDKCLRIKMFLLTPPMVGGGVIIGFTQDFKDQKTFKILYLLVSKRKNINGTYFGMKVASNP